MNHRFNQVIQAKAMQKRMLKVAEEHARMDFVAGDRNVRNVGGIHLGSVEVNPDDFTKQHFFAKDFDEHSEHNTLTDPLSQRQKQIYQELREV